MLRLLLLILLVLAVLAILRQAQGHRRVAAQAPSPGARRRDPYEVLGVSPGDSEAVVRAAYQKLVRENHPDRVADMSAEIRDLAKRRTQELNAAYEEIKRSRRT